jgi:uncharacterized protein YgiM (DUF1202 family)
MKKIMVVFLLFLLVAGALSAQITRGATAWVSVKSVALKSSTWFFAVNRGTVNYADQVTVLQVSGNWAEVRSASNITGWIAVSNLSARRIVASATGSTATAAEVAQAGKGFNQEIENAYKAEGELNYADVDRTEQLVVSDEDLLRFINEGRLTGGEN